MDEDVEVDEVGPGVTREVELAADPERVWDALTDEALASAWLGTDVRWDLRPGGPARFDDGDGEVRLGEVDEVEPGRRLRYRWWPAPGADAGAGASAVSYELEPVAGGTRLVVTEVPVGPTGAVAARACVLGPPTSGASVAWDVRLVSLWLACAAPALVRA